MKYALLLLLSLPAAANWFTGEGEYSLSHEIAFMNYESEEACKGDNGRWADGLCFMDASDEVVVKKTGDEYEVSVDTITTNGHSCGFEGTGQWTMEGILASTPSQAWDGDKFVPVTCEVLLSFVDGNTVNVSNNGQCSEFCGMRASLEISGAKRK